jgi:hypothetical protein
MILRRMTKLVKRLTTPLLIISIFLLGCNKVNNQRKDAEPKPAIHYTILDEDSHDSYGKTQVRLRILVSGEIAEKNLRELLNKLYSKTMKRKFKYHLAPTNVYIYAYVSKDHYESGSQWIAMLDKSYDETAPNIRINESQLLQINAKPEEKFGLSEEKRKEIFKEIVKAEDKSYYEAEKTYPSASIEDILSSKFSKSENQEQLRRQNEYQEVLYDKYKAILAKKYGLERKQMDEIMMEALTEDWAIPSETSEAGLENFLSSEEASQDNLIYLRLVGVVYGDSPDAMIEDVYNKKTHFVNAGDAINNIKIIEIGKDYVLLQFQCEGESVNRKLTDKLHFDACPQ